MPISSSTRNASGVRPSPQVLSRGKSERSSTSTSSPCRLKKWAVAEPPGPAPTITASCMRLIMAISSRRRQRVLVDAHRHPQPVQTEANAALDGAQRGRELGRDLGVAEASEVGELDDLFLL